MIEAGPLSLVRTGPLGIVRAVRRADDEAVRLLAHPRHHDLAALPGAGAGGRDVASAATWAAEGAYAGLREYAPGDDVRHVHWRTSARRGRLMVREHADSALPGITVLVDDRYGPAELDDLAEVAASVVLSGPDFPVELLLAGGGRSPGTAGAAAHLDLLAEATARPGADFAAACGRLRSVPTGRVVVLLPARAAPEDTAAALETLAAQRVLPLVALIGADSGAEPPTPPPAVRLLRAPDPAAFATRWNESRWWTR